MPDVGADPTPAEPEPLLWLAEQAIPLYDGMGL